METTRTNENHDLYNYETANQEFMSLQDEIAALGAHAAQKAKDWWGETDENIRHRVADIKNELSSYDKDPSTWDKIKAGVKEKMVDLRSAYDKAKIRMEEHTS